MRSLPVNVHFGDEGMSVNQEEDGPSICLQMTLKIPVSGLPVVDSVVF